MNKNNFVWNWSIICVPKITCSDGIKDASSTVIIKYLSLSWSQILCVIPCDKFKTMEPIIHWWYLIQGQGDLFSLEMHFNTWDVPTTITILNDSGAVRIVCHLNDQPTFNVYNYKCNYIRIRIEPCGIG